MAEAELVKFEKDGDVAIITVDNPPVNALSPGVPQGITAAIDKGNADPAVKAMVLIGAGRSFIAGADIRQFGKGPSTPPPARRHYDVSDQSPKPIVAAIHGYALGGGLETALACHYRVAVPSAKVGLPEVQIGILPGAGGTQRLPRLTGPKVALELITSGRHVPAAEAQKLGIVDEIVPEGQLREAAIGFARKIADKRPLPVIRERDDKLAEAKSDPALFENFRKSIARRARNQRAPYACIEAVEAAVKLPFDEGIAVERRLFEEQVNSEEAKALRYAFFAEREAQKLPDIPRDIQLRPTDTAAVIGAGTMGGGIAMSFADYGYPVKITDATKEALDRGMQRIRANYETSVKRGSLSAEEMEQRLARIEPVADYEALADCDVLIEVVFEQVPVKQEVWKKIDAVMKPGALLFTNTSGINIDIMANETKRPQDVAGTHFFAPANVMKLFEVVKGTKSAPDVIATAMALGRKIGKVSALAGNTDGFVANRSRGPFGTEMNLLVEEGALPEQVDKVMVDFGYPVGPFVVSDISGLDIGYDVRKRRKAENPNYRGAPIADRIVEAGRLGQKTGKGWYRYEPGDRTPHPDPEVARIIKETVAELGIPQQKFTDEEILKRLLFASVNEACKILDEGKALRASDVDVMWLYGFGFPRYRGGLMYWADTVGVREVYNQIAAWHQRYGERWAPSPLLRRLAESGTPLREAKNDHLR
ncbi:MAG: enoyl-CoA hydratase/isomerase family protein [Alphaproteobacteria bacterium]|nr:enoyl-CoA hydratase/isomerase family protein [Alphaproteobacteria bacterium]MBV9153356.1 enoyl-CoA hydratase/isomerase family protein [Alphaproteobacteria bacterium]